MNGHDRDACAGITAVIVHDQADMLQKLAQRFIFFHRAGKFAQVFEAGRCFGAAFCLQNRRIAAFVHDQPRQVRWRHMRRFVAPAGDIDHQIGEGLACLAG